MIRRLLERFKRKDSVKPSWQSFNSWERPTLLDWQPLYPSLQKDVLSYICPDLLLGIERNQFSSVLKELAPSLYEVRIFNDDFLKLFNKEMESLIDWADRNATIIEPPNSMNNYGVILSEIGYASAMQDLMLSVISPLAKEFIMVS